MGKSMGKTSLFNDNRQLNEKEIREGKIVLKSKPRIFMIMLTATCNLRCIMCPRPDSQSTLPYDIFKKLELLYPYLELINWGGGGEVFTVNYFKKLFLELSRFPNLRHDITTNGLLIDEEWADILSQNKVNLSYSIDAVTEESYEYIRRGAKFVNLIKSINNLNKYRKKHNRNTYLILNVVTMQYNYRDLYLFPRFCKEHNFQHLRIEYLRPVVDPAQDLFTARKDPTAIDYLKKIMPQIETECKNLGIKLDSCIKPFLDSKTQDLINSKELVFNCRLPWQKLLIDGTDKGKIYPDCLCPQALGNIFDDDIEDLWNNQIMQSYRRNILDKTAESWCSAKCLTYQRNG